MRRAVDLARPALDARPDKRLVGSSFGRAAPGYDGVAELQRQVGEDLLAKALAQPGSPGTIVDVGCGTGHCADRLLQVYPQARLIALDLSEGMLRQTRGRPDLEGRGWLVCGDAESLPLAAQTVDLVFSNLALQWCLDLPAVFAGFKRILRPGGVVLFSSFGADTLCELREAWRQVDDYSHVNEFAPKKTVETTLGAAGFDEFAVRSSLRRLDYPSVDALMRELKGLGAHNVTVNRPRHLTGKGAVRKMIAAYEALMPEGRIRGGFEIVNGYARKG